MRSRSVCNASPTILLCALRWSDPYRKTSDTLGFIYFATVVVLLIMFRQTVNRIAEYFAMVVVLLTMFGQKTNGIPEHFGVLIPVFLVIVCVACLTA